MAKAERLVLIDGSWLVFRAFFAIPANLSMASGQQTNAIYGFALMFRKLFAGRRPDLGAVVFDTPGPKKRDLKYPAYKGTRTAAPREMTSQMPYIERLVATYGFPVLREPGLEADDVIGTLAREGREKGLEVLIVAGDKDFAQLISDDVKMFDPMKDVTYDAELVRKKWGVRPDQITDLLAILGDTVDNIPGVSGVGEKGATTLLAQYGTLEGIYEHLEELKGKQKACFAEQREIAFLSKDLATIEQTATIAKRVDELRIPEPDVAAVDAMHRELEFFSFLQGEHAGGEAEAVDVVTDAEAIRTRLAAISGTAAVAFLADIPVPRDDGLRGIAIAGSGGHGGPPHVFWVPVESIDAIVPWLADEEAPKAAHDVKLVWKALKRRGLHLGGVVLDTMIASFLVEPNKCIPHKLDQVTKEYLQRTVRPLKSIIGSGQSEKRIAEVPVADQAAYAGHVAQAVADLVPVLTERMEGEGQTAHFHRVELPLAYVLGQMELDGILVDRDDLGRMGTEFSTRKAEIEQRIYELAGHEFNIGSTQQLGTVLFDELKLPVVKKTKTGWSTDAEVLERLAPKHEIAKLILDQRMLAKLINTYTDVLQAAVSPIDGRIHASFQQTVGVSGRLISTDPDLQRTPVRTPEGKRIRKAFVAPDGFQLISADWSQIELRVLAHFSKDERLLRAFRENTDVHRQTASELFKVPLSDVTPEQRNVGKTINFATIYGQGATALGQILGIPRKEASSYIDGYFATYSGVRQWLDTTIATAGTLGYVETILGRRRYIPELRSLQPMDRTAGERMAANTPIQGSAADLCKLAMLKIAQGLRAQKLKGRMLLQVHDELVFEVPTDEVDAVKAIVREAMERPHPLDVPLVVNVGVGRTWGDAH